MSTPPDPQNDEKLANALRAATGPLDLELPAPAAQMTGARRTQLGGIPPADVEVVTLSRDLDGVLRWHHGSVLATAQMGLRRAGRAAVAPGTVVQQLAFAQIPPNQVGVALQKLDDWLTPNNKKDNLRQWNGQALVPFAGQDAAGKRVLLFIHGTFSKCDNNLSELQAAPGGVGHKFLQDAAKQYDLILTFDHPTVGVSPPMNAFELALLLRPAPKSIDIICHSRGGVVTRWFLEAFAPQEIPARAVMIATSIGGTSLAAPARLKATLNYLANLGDMLGRAAGMASVHPFIGAAAALTRVVTSITRFTAETPVFDAAIAMVPGLAGQARVGNNAELLRLRSNRLARYPDYSIVKANFEAEDPGWNFLKYFRKPALRAADWATDIIFDGPNDLVVDTPWMGSLRDGDDPAQGDFCITDPQKILDFGTTSQVHHTNYYRQPQTIDFIRQQLGIVET